MEINNGVNINSPNSTAQTNTAQLSNVSQTATSSNYSSGRQTNEGMSNEEAMPAIAEKTVVRAIEQANKKLVGSNKEMRLSVHEETKKINIKIIDKETDEVIKEYPPEKLLDIFAKMIELSGIIVDEKR